MRYAEGFGVYTQHYVLHEGPVEPAQRLLLAAGAWANELHNEIWVFNQGFWQKNVSYTPFQSPSRNLRTV